MLSMSPDRVSCIYKCVFSADMTLRFSRDELTTAIRVWSVCDMFKPSKILTPQTLFIGFIFSNLFSVYMYVMNFMK